MKQRPKAKNHVTSEVRRWIFFKIIFSLMFETSKFRFVIQAAENCQAVSGSTTHVFSRPPVEQALRKDQA